MHCHIDWHMASGLMLEFFEATEQLLGLPIPLSHLQNCGTPSAVAVAASTGAALEVGGGAGSSAGGAALGSGLAAAGAVAALLLAGVGWACRSRGSGSSSCCCRHGHSVLKSVPSSEEAAQGADTGLRVGPTLPVLGAWVLVPTEQLAEAEAEAEGSHPATRAGASESAPLAAEI